MSDVINKSTGCRRAHEEVARNAQHGIEKIRTGRANPALLETSTSVLRFTHAASARWKRYGGDADVERNAWDKAMVQPIEKASWSPDSVSIQYLRSGDSRAAPGADGRTPQGIRQAGAQEVKKPNRGAHVRRDALQHRKMR